jgi:lysyl-tRNA synthetase class 2
LTPSLDSLRARARAVASVRAFFTARGYLEVDTPILRACASMEPHLISFETALHLPGGAAPRPLFMHTSPEYAMKRALAAYPHQPLFQLATVFRDGEQSPSHNHEFSLLEWYRPGATYLDLMEETEALVRFVARSLRPASSPAPLPVSWRHLGGGDLSGDLGCDLSAPFERLTVHAAFARFLGLDLCALTDAASLRDAARACGSSPGDDWPWEDTFHLLLLDHIEPHLGAAAPCFLLDYPPSLAALSVVRRDPALPPVAERFELYACGLELCNGFTELTDPLEQRRRFIDEQRQRASLGLAPHPLDEGLLRALKDLPPCAGNALGFDRLLMLVLGCDAIQAVRLCDID